MSPPSEAAAAAPVLVHCRSLPGTTEDVKWGNDLVFSVGEKMYACVSVDDFDRVSLKVDPLVFESLTAQDGIEPAPYLARHSWILLPDRRVLPEDVFWELLTASHALVAAKLPKKKRRELGLAIG